jgi:hypothetical protein
MSPRTLRTLPPPQSCENLIVRPVTATSVVPSIAGEMLSIVNELSVHDRPPNSPSLSNDRNGPSELVAAPVAT